MKVVSWNCRGCFRDKCSNTFALNADIYVIQECENPDKYPTSFAELPFDYVWQGEHDNKGLAIFISRKLSYTINEWPAYCLRHFISLRINDIFDLVGVWAGPPYIEEYYIYQSINIDKYSNNTILIGDFNSNAVWDKEHRSRNHSAVVMQLQNVGIVSAYHYVTGEKHGFESQPTFFLYKHRDKPYHIDYCFLNPDQLRSFKLLDNNIWIELSDHLPLLVEVDIAKE